MIPESTNVYGTLTAPEGLESVRRMVEPFWPDAAVYRSQFSGAETLRLCTDTAEFQSTPLAEAGRHLLNGQVGGSLDGVIRLVKDLSGVLASAGIEHSFEVYDDEVFVRRIPV